MLNLKFLYWLVFTNSQLCCWCYITLFWGHDSFQSFFIAIFHKLFNISFKPFYIFLSKYSMVLQLFWVMFSALALPVQLVEHWTALAFDTFQLQSIIVFSLLPLPPWICPPLICFICYLCFILLYISLCCKITILSEGFTDAVCTPCRDSSLIRFFTFLLPFKADSNNQKSIWESWE